MAETRARRWREPEDGTDERTHGRTASLRERGHALIDLLGLVDAVGRYPEPRTRWPGFPRAAHRRAEGKR